MLRVIRVIRDFRVIGGRRVVTVIIGNVKVKALTSAQTPTDENGEKHLRSVHTERGRGQRIHDRKRDF